MWSTEIYFNNISDSSSAKKISDQYSTSNWVLLEHLERNTWDTTIFHTTPGQIKAMTMRSVCTHASCVSSRVLQDTPTHRQMNNTITFHNQIHQCVLAQHKLILLPSFLIGWLQYATRPMFGNKTNQLTKLQLYNTNTCLVAHHPPTQHTSYRENPFIDS